MKLDTEIERNVLFVFGAGASFADGVPLQKDILKLLFESTDKNLSNSDASIEVKEFIQKNFYISNNNYPSLEAIFGYLDYFINKNESLGSGYTTAKIIDIREALIQLIHYVIASSTLNDDEKNLYRYFWEVVSVTNKNISIITMNYDTLLDESFDFLYNKVLIDYCIELMNYHHYENIDTFDWWINPRNTTSTKDEYDSKIIKIIKIHGSLNWKYCNCCNQVLLTAWNTKIDLSSMGFKGYIYGNCANPETIEFDLVCPLDKNRFETFIVPPSHIKDLSHPVINKLLDESSIEVRKAKKIVFVGYSFPEADVHIKALFKKNIQTDIEIHVIDPYLNENIRANYKCLSNSIYFYEKTFKDFISDELAILLKT
jgi:NAD-dependent SIR2 family protein deacetylase